jgi:hypothetical protein
MEKRFSLSHQIKIANLSSLPHLVVFISMFFLLFFINQKIYADRQYARFEPPDGKKLVIIGQDKETIEGYIHSIKIPPSGFMVYTSIQKMDGLDYESPDYGSGINHAEQLIKKYPNTVLQIGLYMVDALQDTYNGRYDENIKKLAIWLKKVDVPVFLRVGYECDGVHNHYNPDDYKKAYRYLVDKLKFYEVNNVAYVWHVHAHQIKPDLDSWFPGNDYVDWVGFSYFNQPQVMMESVVNFARNHHKPVMVAESTPKGVGASNGKLWYDAFFHFINKNGIKAFSYINSNWEGQNMWKGQGWRDARVQTDGHIKQLWYKEISKDNYLKSSPGLYLLIGKK